MSSSYLELREAIAALPCIDAHVHSKGFDNCRPIENVADFIFGNILSMPFKDRGLGARLTCEDDGSDRDKWTEFLEIWPCIRGSGYGRGSAKLLEVLEVNPDDLTPETYHVLKEKLRRHDGVSAREAYGKLGIRASLSHHIGHPCHGGLDSVRAFLDDDLEFDDTFLPLLGTLPFHDFRNGKDLDEVEKTIGTNCGSLDELIGGIRALIDKCVSKGAVGLKDHSAYTRGLAFSDPDRSAAEAALKQIRGGKEIDLMDNDLSDYIFHDMIRAAVDHGVPVAMHTGLLVWEGAPAKCNVSQLAELLDRHRDARFDLYHLSFPWFEDMLVLMHQCPNCAANCAWAHDLDPAGTEFFLARALGSLPADRVFGFGSEGGAVERVAAQLALAKDGIAGALATAVDRGQISTKAALDVAAIWLYKAPAEFYKLTL